MSTVIKAARTERVPAAGQPGEEGEGEEPRVLVKDKNSKDFNHDT